MQLVDFADGLDTAEHFDAFMEKRRKAMAGAINEFLGLAAASTIADRQVEHVEVGP